MAAVTKYYLMEQVRTLLAGGPPSSGMKYEPRDIWAFMQQVINKKLKIEHLTVTLPGDETIPEGLVLASYDGIPVERYKGLSRAKLPAMPVYLRRNMGIFFVGPNTPTLILDTPGLSAEVAGGGYEIDLTWTSVLNATNYVLERAEDPTFTLGLLTIYSGPLLTKNDSLAIVLNTVYYYRLKAQAPLYRDSSYGYASIRAFLKIFDDTFDVSFR